MGVLHGCLVATTHVNRAGFRVLISEEYRQLNAELWERYGPTELRERHLAVIKALSSPKGTILDYGCGQPGHLRDALGDRVTNYDPAIPEFASRPKPAWIVVCAHVLEHVEPECLEAVLDDLRSLSNKWVILVIHMEFSRQILADGRNAHQIVKPYEWWMPKLNARWDCTQDKSSSRVILYVGRKR